MQVVKNIKEQTKRSSLKEFTRAVIAFFGCLVVLSLYQYIRLYANGVLDSFLNKSFFTLVLHHVGFVALTSLFLAFVFNFLENKRPRLGFKVICGMLLLFILTECLLVEYYVRQYEILSYGGLGLISSKFKFGHILLFGVGFSLIAGGMFYYFYRITSSFQRIISKMYPLTIVLFSLFLATLIYDSKPINENKLQHLFSSTVSTLFDFNTYEGDKEYPLLQPYQEHNVLGSHFNLDKRKPNIVFLVLDGVGSDFVGEKSIYKGFTPFLDSLATASLYWPNYLSNTGEGAASIPTIVGSLPFGENGFSNIEQPPNRNTLFSILKSNGYHTAFNFGGNTALDHYDKFMFGEHIDHILDNKNFDNSYSKQNEDVAGISLGYPDAELFKKWNTDYYVNKKPRMEVFMTQSTKAPFLIPNHKVYEDRVGEIVSKSYKLSGKSRRLINKHKEVFASVLYADEAISNFFEAFKKQKGFNNTIFIITGSHNMGELPQETELDRYRVPLLIYSPLLKEKKTIASIASHADLAPSLISLLKERYRLKIPQKTSWLGNTLITDNVLRATKEIPLFRNKKHVQDYIHGNHFVSRENVYKLGEGLEIMELDSDSIKNGVQKKFKDFRAINKYVTANDKIIPKENTIYPQTRSGFTKQEMVWINSVFNGNNVDKAYLTARDLAWDNNRDRALLLCKYILVKVPGHADAEVLMGRINGWQGNYENAIHILKNVTRKYPTYADGYCALMDVYFWADRNEEAANMAAIIRKNNVKNLELFQKLTRARKEVEKNKLELSAENNINHPVQGAYTASVVKE